MANRGHRKRKNRPRKRGRGKGRLGEGPDGQIPAPDSPGHCEVCNAALGVPGGYAGTGMCGPCCTGEADTLSEFGETW